MPNVVGGEGMGYFFLGPPMQVSNVVWMVLFPEPSNPNTWERRLVYVVVTLQETGRKGLLGEWYVAMASLHLLLRQKYEAVCRRGYRVVCLSCWWNNYCSIRTECTVKHGLLEVLKKAFAEITQLKQPKNHYYMHTAVVCSQLIKSSVLV